MAELLIREAEDRDRPDLVRLMADLHRFEADLEENRADDAASAAQHLDFVLSELSRSGGTVLVAERAGRVVGFISYAIDEDPGAFVRPERRRFGMIWDISVEEEARGGGVGRALLEAIEARMQVAGVPEARMFVLAGNARAQRIYEAAGYRPYEIFMSKRLGRQEA